MLYLLLRSVNGSSGLCFLMSMKALYKNVPFFGVRMSFARDLGLDLAVHLFRMFFFFFFM